MEETPTRCRCGRRILVTYGRTDCVYCLKDAAACRCDDLTLDADGFGEVAFFPAGKYKLEGRPGGWALLTRDDGGAFT